MYLVVSFKQVANYNAKCVGGGKIDRFSNVSFN